MYLRSKKLLLSGLGLFLALSAFTQNYLPGYIVSLKGDTTKGLINYRNWSKNPGLIEFKTFEKEKTLTYGPKDIIAFAIETKNTFETYKSANISIETSSEVIDQLDPDRAFNEQQKHVFLLTIYSGFYNLYHYQDHKSHFFIGKGDDIKELRFKKYLVNGENKIATNEAYKPYLESLLKDCASISAIDINKTAYAESSLIGLLRKYDDCKGIKPSKVATKEKIKAVFGLVAGTDISILNIKNDAGRDAKITSAGNFVVGASLAIKLPRNNRSSIINIELLYRRYKFEENESDKQIAYPYDSYHNYLTANYLKNNIMYRYQWTMVKLKPFINLGLSQAIKFGKIDKSTGEKVLSTTITSPNLIFADERSYEQGINLGAGLELGKIALELRAETTNGFSPYVNTKSSVNSLYLNLGYHF